MREVPGADAHVEVTSGEEKYTRRSWEEADAVWAEASLGLRLAVEGEDDGGVRFGGGNSAIHWLNSETEDVSLVPEGVV